MQNNLIYLAYGHGPHEDELIYSVLSALHMQGRHSGRYRIVIYTDNPSTFGGLPVDIEPLSEEVLADWAGSFNFNHRRKIFVVKNALEKFGGRLIYCDSDTLFLKDPSNLFARVGPGRTLLHIEEYRLYELCAKQLADFVRSHSLQGVTGDCWNIPQSTMMFNAGVIGLHESDISLLDAVLHLTDQIYPHVRIHSIEQFAFSVCLAQRTKLRQSYDIVHHYWNPTDRALFRQQLERVLHDESVSPSERFCRLMPNQPVQKLDYRFRRPTTRFKIRTRLVLSHAAERVGVKNQLKATWQRVRRTTAVK